MTRLSPVLRPVMDVQDLDSLSFHRIDDHIRKRRKRKFSRLRTMTGSPAIGEIFREQIR